MSDNIIKYSSPGNLISFNIDKFYNISNLNIDRTLIVEEQKELLEEMIISSMNEAISKINELNAGEEKLEIKKDAQKKPFNPFNIKDIDNVFGDITKMTTIKYDENGKPIINISLDAISPDIMSKVNDIMSNYDDKKDDDKE